MTFHPEYNLLDIKVGMLVNITQNNVTGMVTDYMTSFMNAQGKLNSNKFASRLAYVQEDIDLKPVGIYPLGIGSTLMLNAYGYTNGEA